LVLKSKFRTNTELTMSPITRTLLAALLVSTGALAGGIHSERVHFAKGANSATVAGRIQGDMTIDYLLGAKQGQSMNVSLATDNGANYFNIIAPGKGDEALFVGSTSSNQFEGTLPASGHDKVRVYLMRSAARRDEIANYRLGFLDDKNSARLSQIFSCGPNSPLSLGGKIAGGHFLVNTARGRCLRRRWRLADRRIVTREDRVHGRGGAYA
jgi:hypothetical protein